MPSASQVSLTSAASTVVMWGLSVPEVAVIVSTAVAVLTFCIHVWYTLRKDARAQAAHEQRMDPPNGETQDDRT